jgi:hypothetical protein
MTFMRNSYSLCPLAFLLLISSAVYAQSVGIGTTKPDSTAQLDITSASHGLLIPRVTSFVLSVIAHPAKGLMVYDTTRNQLMVNMGTSTNPDWETIVANSGWSLYGNSGTDPGNQFIGTTDDQDLSFRVNNATAGKIMWGEQNSFFGYNAGAANTNSALGNTGIGAYALAQNSGGNNVACGDGAMAVNTGGNANTALGYQALTANTNGNDNVGVGSGALFNNNVGLFNTAVGVSAMVLNTAGNYNVAVGSSALYNTTASWYNTAIGFNSGLNFDNGYNNVFVGANNDVNGAGYFNVVAIGQDVICTASSQARIGNEATNSIGGYANWTNFSDGRYKKNIQENVKGLDFIMRLRPITYNLDVSAIRSYLGKKAPKDAGTAQSLIDRGATVFSGFSAQEVEKAAGAAGYDFSGVDKPKNAADFYGLRYGDFVVPLVKAVQEQQQLIETLQKRLDEQDKLIAQLLKDKK